MCPKAKTLIIGIGNEYRADDAVGLHVARELARLGPPGCLIKELSGEGSQLMNAWRDHRRVILVDAVRSSARPGTVHRVNVLEEELSDNRINLSAHTISLPEAVNLARALKELPEQLLVFGIEGVKFEPGIGLSDEVRQAADHLVSIILDEVRNQQVGRAAVNRRPPRGRLSTPRSRCSLRYMMKRF